MDDVGVSIGRLREFHVSRLIRERYGFDATIFASRGPVVFGDLSQARVFAYRLNKHRNLSHQPEQAARPEDIYVMGLIDEILHYVVYLYGQKTDQRITNRLLDHLYTRLGKGAVDSTLYAFTDQFPPAEVYHNKTTVGAYLESVENGESGREAALEELLMLWIQNQNPAYARYAECFDDTTLRESTDYVAVSAEITAFFESLPVFGPDQQTLVAMLRAPAIVHPDSLEDQLRYIRERWGRLLGRFLMKLLRGLDYLHEVNRFFANRLNTGTRPSSEVYSYHGDDVERFSPDRDWMPKLVLLAKSALVWLDQLSKRYRRDIVLLDQIPDEELDTIARRGFTGLWLIGLWRRSPASKRIKQLCGNPDAEASAYSLDSYDIAEEIGGWDALHRLRDRCWQRGIRLASDMVPNHTGIDSSWVIEHPDWFLQTTEPPFPAYQFSGEDLARGGRVAIRIDDHYYDRSDAAVVFQHIDNATGRVRYLYHGNDGTHMPWNDTAQLNYLMNEVREAVIQTILHVARSFPIIRFDAAMTLAKKHIQRLWFPEPGSGGDIPSRSAFGLTRDEFERAIPVEFWRQVVDRCAQEAPDTLLLAEAFWMMEGYFVRTLGMHRVYNSAFMNMLKNQDNAQYRQVIRNTLQFDKEILKRFVNFMNNPDEETAIAQFGTGDKYFGVLTMMITLPGLPMFGHGQIEGFSEKYGMEYRRAYMNEEPNAGLVERHEREIFPLLQKRYLFAGVENFYLYDMVQPDGAVNENVFAYSNASGYQKVLVVYNNAIERCYGTINWAVEAVDKDAAGNRALAARRFAEVFHLKNDENAYCMLRDVKQNRWYIRRSSQLYAQGLSVVLDGYECQVFADAYEVEDNEFGHYRRVHNYLNGASTDNVENLLKEIIFEPVYRALDDAFSGNWAVDLVKALSGPVEPEVLERLEAATRGLVQDLSRYSGDPEQFEAEAAMNVTRLMVDLNGLQTMLTAVDVAVVGAAQAAYRRAVNPDAFLHAQQAYVVLRIVGGQNESWEIDHYLSRTRFPGLDVGQLRAASAVLEETFDDATPTEMRHPADILRLSLDHTEFVQGIGVNRFEDVLWVHQESFERVARLVFCMGMLHQNAAVQAATWYEQYQEWLGAAVAGHFALAAMDEHLRRANRLRERRQAAKSVGTAVSVAEPGPAASGSTDNGSTDNGSTDNGGTETPPQRGPKRSRRP